MSLIGAGAFMNSIVNADLSRWSRRVWRAIAFLLLLACTPPAMACDEGQKWGFNPDAITRAIRIISEGDFPSNISKGNCAVRLHQRLSTLKSEAVCVAFHAPYSKFLRVLSKCLSKAITSAQSSDERFFFVEYRDQVVVETASFESTSLLVASKEIAPKISSGVDGASHYLINEDPLMQSNGRILDAVPTLKKTDN